MKQTRWMSFVESVANVLVGYGVAVLTQMLVFRFLECEHPYLTTCSSALSLRWCPWPGVLLCGGCLRV